MAKLKCSNCGWLTRMHLSKIKIVTHCPRCRSRLEAPILHPYERILLKNSKTNKKFK